MRAFITVGSTEFEQLVQAATSDAVLASLFNRGYTELVVQCGNSKLQPHDALNMEKNGVMVNIWRKKPSLLRDLEQADLVISHAGSGTILEVLRLGKPLIVVPNPTLLDNHQAEIAEALEQLNYLKSSTPSQLAETIDNFDKSSIIEFPPFDGSRFRDLLDEEMGF
ncbi:glycosyltransferase family 1 protein [Mycena floridula]|nr:glycosyltransferase family 1 protein [Mycena floridula]